MNSTRTGPQPKRQVAFFSAAGLTRGIDPSESIARVIHAKRYVLADEVRRFEARFAEYCAVEHCIGVANGTDALEIGLRALGVGPGHLVIVVANAGFYGSAAVRAVGATPWYCDVDAQTRNMDPKFLEAMLARRRTAAAIIVTHLYGRLAPMPELVAIAQKFDTPIVEDCAQAHGAWANEKRAGTWGEVGCFSFYPTKNLGALGDGGGLITKRPHLASKIRSLRQYGWGRKYQVDLASGRNSRLDELQAAILNDKLALLDEANISRAHVARKYVAQLAGLPLQLATDHFHASDNFPELPSNVSHLFVIETEHRDPLRAHLTAAGIGNDIHYPIPDHLQPAYRCEQLAGSLPVTERLCKQVLSLPCYPDLSDADIKLVCDTIRTFYLAQET